MDKCYRIDKDICSDIVIVSSPLGTGHIVAVCIVCITCINQWLLPMSNWRLAKIESWHVNGKYVASLVFFLMLTPWTPIPNPRRIRSNRTDRTNRELVLQNREASGFFYVCFRGSVLSYLPSSSTSVNDMWHVGPVGGKGDAMGCHERLKFECWGCNTSKLGKKWTHQPSTY